MPTQITDQFLKPYIHEKLRHKAYAETVEIMNRIKVHADGDYPGALIDDYRPSESKDVKEYRKKIFVAITKFVFAKIVNCLSKIRKSQDWSIKYDPKKVPSSLKQGESLKDYCEFNYPTFKSVTNWTFNVLLKNYLMDPNAICLVMPQETVVAENGYLKPIAMVFNSDRVLDYVEDDYAVIHSTDKATYEYKNQKFHDGDVYYIVSRTEIQRWEQISPSKDMAMKLRYVHGLSKMPCWKVKGVFRKMMDDTTIWESRIDSIVPRLTEAVREYSDLQGGVVTTLNMEKWEYTTQDCPECKGTQKIKKGDKIVTCKKCSGLGSIATSPYAKKLVKVPKAGDPVVPTPPAGFIPKPVEILVLQDKRVEKHMWWALCAVNMEFLMQVPMAESGISKEWDRDEFNNFVNAVAEDLVANDDEVYYFINEIRYKVIVPDEKKRQEMLPNIPVPEKFDMVNSGMLGQELAAAKTAKLSPRLISAMEAEYANKKFQNEPEIKDQINLIHRLDPFPGKEGADKMSELTNGGITRIDYIISCNIDAFVNRAIAENVGNELPFAKMDPAQQKKLMVKYAKEVDKANSAAEKIMGDLKNEDDDDPENKAA